MRARARTFLHGLLLALALLGGARAQDVLPVPALTAASSTRPAPCRPRRWPHSMPSSRPSRPKRGRRSSCCWCRATAPEDIASYAQRVGDSWKIGRRDVGDGVLLVVAKNERRVRIEVAKALEGAIPDLAARQIIDNAIRPAFRADDYAGGLNAAVDQLIGRIKGEDLPAPAARGGARPGLQLDELAMFFFVAVPIIGAVLTGLFGRKFGSVLTAGAAGGLGWWFTASVLAGVGAAVVALVLVGLFGIGSAMRRAGQSGRGLPHIGGWGGGGGRRRGRLRRWRRLLVGRRRRFRRRRIFGELVR